MTFEYNYTKQNGINTYSLKGELIDKMQSAELLQDIESAITKNENKILLNFEDLEYINSSGLNVLISILTKSRKSGGEVAIFNVNQKITELLVITKLNNVFNVRSTAAEAIEMLNKTS
ncbi:MAG TPA: STAS domain-containing protein [Bacteroidia bacterium]|nr:STAS domain-containing protein [Bacteroidia bacterium]